MKVLIACEFSGIVRDAFLAHGHDAVSCDLLPTERPGPHIQGDVLEHLGDGWDLMIAHPPCKYLSRAGARFWNQAGRRKKQREAMAFFMELWNAMIPRTCIENPVGYPWTAFRRPDQTIDPYMFGDPVRKRTCLWLRSLPPLTDNTGLFPAGKTRPCQPPKPVFVDSNGKARHFVDSVSNTPDRAKIRSRTFQGIASAMAEQWGTRQ